MFRFRAVVLTRELLAWCERVRLGHLRFRSAMGDAMPRMLSRLTESLLPSELEQQAYVVEVVKERQLVPRLSHESTGLPDPPWRLVAAGP